MFNKRTVFIVGAGASAECGLPTGHQLKEAIAGGVRFQFDAGGLSKGDKDLLDILQARFSNVEPHVKAGRDLAATITTFPSIDEALHWWSARSEIVELGKIAIAHYILAAERRCSMARRDGQIKVDSYWGTWLGLFLSMALSALERDEAPKAFEQVTIINFNYDRTIEHFLYWALQQRAGVQPDHAAECVARLKVIRPYGSIGKLEWQDRNGVPLGGHGHLKEVSAVVGNIRTFTEQIQEPDLLSSINATLNDAHLVIFLGFGFHQQNVELFKPSPDTSRLNAAVIATTKGMDDENTLAIERRLNQLGFVSTPILIGWTAAELMERLRPTISMAVA